MAKPLNKPAAPVLPRERIWAAVRVLNRLPHPFTLRDIEREITRVGRAAKPAMRRVNGLAILEYLRRLECAGILARSVDGLNRPMPGSVATWTMIRDAGIDAPHLDARGREVDIARWREQVWRAIRIVRGHWDTDQLAALASTPEYPARPNEVRAYCGHLVRAGYLMIVREATRKEPARLCLKPGMWTGPKPPAVLKLKAVFDRNLGKTMCLEDAAEAADAA